MVASNLLAILLPIGLDVMLWLGPRLHIDRLFKPFFDEMSRYAMNSGLTNADASAVQAAFTEFVSRLQQFNLLSVVRTFPIGVFSLMSGRLATNTPLGFPTAMQVDSAQTLLFWIGMLTLAGWVCGSLFFRWIASLVTDSPAPSALRFGNDVLQTLLLSVVWITLVFMVGIPAFILLSLMVAASPLVAQGVLLIGGLLSMWLIVPFFFTPHGIFIEQQNAITSIYNSFRIARFTLPTSSLFVISVLLIAFGLNYLWSIPSSDSWMTLVGIIGHAFITTSLLAASFIYYRDMHAWLLTVLNKFKSNLPAGQA